MHAVPYTIIFIVVYYHSKDKERWNSKLNNEDHNEDKTRTLKTTNTNSTMEFCCLPSTWKNKPSGSKIHRNQSEEVIKVIN